MVDEKSKFALVEEMRQLLANWFDHYVILNLDSSRYPVTGGGQVKKIGLFQSGETSFLTRGWSVISSSCKLSLILSAQRFLNYPHYTYRRCHQLYASMDN